jgi:hypothetical protein
MSPIWSTGCPASTMIMVQDTCSSRLWFRRKVISAALAHFAIHEVVMRCDGSFWLTWMPREPSEPKRGLGVSAAIAQDVTSADADVDSGCDKKDAPTVLRNASLSASNRCKPMRHRITRRSIPIAVPQDVVWHILHSGIHALSISSKGEYTTPARERNAALVPTQMPSA